MAKFKDTDLELTRANDEMRDVEVELNFTPNALASVLYKQGDTVVLACCTRARNLPRWFPRDATKGWVNAEYSLLPGSTDSRFQRERRGAKGRTYEIERLVARSLRAGIDLEDLSGIAVTHGPGLAGSLLVGLNIAKGLAFGLGLPLFGVNHLEGHIYANWLEERDPEIDPGFPLMLSLIHI